MDKLTMLVGRVEAFGHFFRRLLLPLAGIRECTHTHTPVYTYIETNIMCFDINSFSIILI